MPSVSLAPIASPSSSPPSASFSPTETCYDRIEIAIIYDFRPQDTSWFLERMNNVTDDATEIKSHRGAIGDTSHTQSICLSEGEYEFAIRDSFGWFWGYYNVTASNGDLIAQGPGGEFQSEERTMFSIPFVPAL